MTPLIRACDNDDLDIVTLLIDHGAETVHRDEVSDMLLLINNILDKIN